MGDPAAIGGSGWPGDPAQRTDFGIYRAAFLRNGVDPRAWETMSLYELESMMRALAKLDNKGRAMTDDEFEASKQRWRDLGLPDVRV